MTTATRNHVRTERFSGTCDACVYPIVTEIPTETRNKVRIPCPSCSAPVIVQRLFGVYNDTNCDARCQYAIGSMCSCSCGGTNHQAGYIPPTFAGEVTADALARFRTGYAKRAAASQARAEAKRQAKAAEIAQAVSETLASLENDHVALALLPDTDLTAAFPMAEGGYDVATISDIRNRFNRTGYLSPRQEEFVATLIAKAFDRAAYEAERAAEVKVPARTGRIAIEGVVVSRKWREDAYGGSIKITLKVTEDDGIWLCWMTEPRAVETERGDVLRVTATITASDTDPSFSFGKRPSKAEVIDRVALDADALADPEEI